MHFHCWHIPCKDFDWRETPCCGNETTFGNSEKIMLEGIKVLLVDNDEGIRKSLSLFFQDQCNLMHSFENAKDVLDFIGWVDYDLILCDFILPDMLGLDFFKIIKNRYRNSLKILMTAYGNDISLKQMNASGIDYVLLKPFSGDTLENILTELIKNKRSLSKITVSAGSAGNQSPLKG